MFKNTHKTKRRVKSILLKKVSKIVKNTEKQTTSIKRKYKKKLQKIEKEEKSKIDELIFIAEKNNIPSKVILNEVLMAKIAIKPLSQRKKTIQERIPKRVKLLLEKCAVALQEVDPKLSTFIMKELKIGTKKSGPWPSKFKWFQEDKKIQEICKKYKYLLPLLITLYDSNGLYLKFDKIVKIAKNMTKQKPVFTKEKNNEYYYALMDLSKNRDIIAKELGCSESTLSNYIKGLIECGLMLHFQGQRRHYYAIAYWRSFITDRGMKAMRRQYFLSSSSKQKLYEFRPKKQ